MVNDTLSPRHFTLSPHNKVTTSPPYGGREVMSRLVWNACHPQFLSPKEYLVTLNDSSVKEGDKDEKHQKYFDYTEQR